MRIASCSTADLPQIHEYSEVSEIGAIVDRWIEKQFPNKGPNSSRRGRGGRGDRGDSRGSRDRPGRMRGADKDGGGDDGGGDGRDKPEGDGGKEAGGGEKWGLAGDIFASCACLRGPCTCRSRFAWGAFVSGGFGKHNRTLVLMLALLPAFFFSLREQALGMHAVCCSRAARWWAFRCRFGWLWSSVSKRHVWHYVLHSASLVVLLLAILPARAANLSARICHELTLFFAYFFCHAATLRSLCFWPRALRNPGAGGRRGSGGNNDDDVDNNNNDNNDGQSVAEGAGGNGDHASGERTDSVISDDDDADEHEEVEDMTGDYAAGAATSDAGAEEGGGGGNGTVEEGDDGGMVSNDESVQAI